MPKYNVSLKVRFETEGENTAEAIKNVIYTLTNNFKNVHALELSNIFEFQEKDLSMAVFDSQAESKV